MATGAGPGGQLAGVSVAGMAALVAVYVVKEALDWEAPQIVLLAAVGVVTFLVGYLVPAARTTVARWRAERRPPDPPRPPCGE